MNLRPSGYEPDELPDCSTPRQRKRTIAKPRPHVKYYLHNLFFLTLEQAYLFDLLMQTNRLHQGFVVYRSSAVLVPDALTTSKAIATVEDIQYAHSSDSFPKVHRFTAKIKLLDLATHWLSAGSRHRMRRGG